MWAHEQAVHAAWTPLLLRAPPSPLPEHYIITAGGRCAELGSGRSHSSSVGVGGEARWFRRERGARAISLSSVAGAPGAAITRGQR